MFASVGFAIFALEEMAIDIIWLSRAWWRRAFIYSKQVATTSATIPMSPESGRLAIFVPAWDESDVIAETLSHALRTYGDQAFDIFVGCYPNDSATQEAVDRVLSPFVHKTLCSAPGPTTKADCLNQLWRSAASIQAHKYKGIVLHDAEDIVSPAELAIFDAMLDRFDLVQLPVVPFTDPSSRFIAGHYCDEFAEAHGKTMIVRECLGAGIPSAGVGCAIRWSALEVLAVANGGMPFDVGSLTEDYELGINLRAAGLKTVFVRIPTTDAPGIVATQAYFPATLDTAVRQKTRWVLGIALAGWDRLGWGGAWGENWMRLRDRRAVVAAILLLAGYLAMVLYALILVADYFLDTDGKLFSPVFTTIMIFNTVALVWRCIVRAYFVGRIYGAGEALLSVIRLPVSNIIAMMAARRAVLQYFAYLSVGTLRWDKTAHRIPDGMKK